MTEQIQFVPEGVYPALPTAISDDGSINYEAQQNHLGYLEEGGVQGVVPGGCTGHAGTLGDMEGENLYDEHVEFISRVSDMTDLEIIAGDGMNSTRQTIDLASRIEDKADIDAHLMISPYQNCPPQDLIVRHYEEIAEEVEEPIIAYNVPGRTGRNIEPETVEELAEIEGVIGLKEASNDPDQIEEIGRRLEAAEDISFSGPASGGSEHEEGGFDEFYLGSGDDPRNPLVYESGGNFAISVSGNVAPERSAEVWRRAERGDYDGARELNEELMPLHNAMFQEGEKNPISVQYALNELGFDFGTPRMPLDREPREDEEYRNRTEIEEVLEDLGFYREE